MEAPVPKNPSQSKIPEAINCKFDYQPSIRLANLVIEIEQGAHLPDEWQNLINNLAKEGFSLSIQEKAMFEMLLKSAPTSPETKSAINVGAYLEKRAVVIRYLARAIKSWNVPAQNLNYVERFQNEVNLIEQIKGHFVEKQTYLVLTALYGLGGIGKTQLALAYVWKYRQDYQGIYWFGSDTKERLLSEYITFGQELKLYGEEDKQMSKEERAKRVKTWLENRGGEKWLIVLDNPVKHNDIKDLLPTQGGHILITSRYTEWPGNRLGINVFSKQEAYVFTKKIIGDEKVEQESLEVKQLITLLGKLPLALAQAYAYISKNEIKVKEYLALYKEIRNELLSKHLLPPGDEHEVITITWNVTLRKMKEECPDSVELLYGCTHLHHEAIPYQVIEALLVEDQTTLNAALLKFKALEAKRIAKEYSMITVDETNRIFSLHNLVQQIIRDQLVENKKDFNYLLNGIKVLDNLYPYGKDKERMEDYAFKIALKSHLEEVLKHLDKCPAEFILSGEAKKSCLNLEKDIKINILIRLANAYHALGDAREQKTLLERALRIEELHYGKEHVEVAKTLVNLAIAYGALGDAKEKKALLERALKIKEAHYGKEHVEVAKTLVNLANTYGSLGDAKEQKTLLERALRIEELHYGKEHSEVAITLFNLGIAYFQQNNLIEAKGFIKKAYDIFVNSPNCGVNHPYTQKAKNLLNVIQSQQLKSHVGIQPDNWRAWLNLADHYYQQNNLADALQCYATVITLSPENSYTHHQLAKLHHLSGQLTLAAQHFELALKLKRSSLVYCDYGLLLFRKRQFKKAVQMFSQVPTCEDTEEKLDYGEREASLLDSHLQQKIMQHGCIKIPVLLFAFYSLIKCYKELGIKDDRVTNTLEAFCGLVQLEPEPLYYRLLSNSFRDLGNKAEAENYDASATALEMSLQAEVASKAIPLVLMPAETDAVTAEPKLAEPPQEKSTLKGAATAKMNVKVAHVFESKGPTFKFPATLKSPEEKAPSKEALQNPPRSQGIAKQ